MPGNTWIATGMAPVYLGARPVIVDVEPGTLCLDPEQARRAITRRTKAIIPVHLFGSMADMDRFMALSRETGIPIIEDCAHSQGGFWKGRGLGSIGRIGSFSFQQSKTLSSGGICADERRRPGRPALPHQAHRLRHGQKQDGRPAADRPHLPLTAGSGSTP